MAHLQEPPLTLSPYASAPSPSRARSKTMGSLRPKKRKKRKSATPKSTHHSSRMRTFKERSIPRKLGPRDIGRIKYKDGTKYEETKTYGTFLDEKIHRQAKTNSFLQRKSQNPVPKKETVQQTGTPNDWKKPQYYKTEVQKMYNYHNAKRQGWGGSMQFLSEKPSKPKDARLEALKHTHIPKGMAVKEYGSPHSWKPIAFKHEHETGGFLDEKFWFEASHVQIDGGLSRLIEALTPRQKLKLNKLPAPTGYQSKINFLKMLRDLVMLEVKRINQEDNIIKKMENEVFLDDISKQIEKEFEQEMNDALDEVLQASDSENMVGNNCDDEMVVVTLDVDEEKKGDILEVIYSDEEEENDEVGDMLSEQNNHDNVLGSKYRNLVRRKKSDMGMLQRQLLTMKSVNTLTNIIDGLEKQQTE